MPKIEEAMVGWWGERCSDFDETCPICQAWDEFDTRMTHNGQVEGVFVMPKIEEAMVGWWGERCSDFDETCPICQAWDEFDTRMTHNGQVEGYL